MTVSASSPLRWLVVGAGDIARKRVVPALLADPHSRVVAVCDLDRDRAGTLAATCGAQVFNHYDAALASAPADAVYLCTPVGLHVPQAMEALRAGRHVLVEKPVALNYAQAQTLVAEAAGRRLKCGVAYFRRFSPKYAMAREMLARGEFGKVVLVRMTYFSWFNPVPSDPKYWRVVPERSGGGPISDMGTHMFDVLIGLLGLPETVFAKAESLVQPYAVEDSSVAILTMPGGAQVLASFHWCTRTWSHEFEIVGTEAKVKWHPYDGDSVIRTVGRDTAEVATPHEENVHAPLIADFVAAVMEDRAPAVTAAEAAKTNAVVDALYRSARERREVALSEVLQ
jgi:1,5-anhydro-D-fructose reductase (1,5-anhydro-D-mannitol-forming)